MTKELEFSALNVSSGNYRRVFLRSCFRLKIGCVCELIGVCAATLCVATVILLEILSEILIFVPFLWISRSFGVRNKLDILPQRDLRIRMLFSARRSGVWLNNSSKNFVRRGCCRGLLLLTTKSMMAGAQSLVPSIGACSLLLYLFKGWQGCSPIEERSGLEFYMCIVESFPWVAAYSEGFYFKFPQVFGCQFQIMHENIKTETQS